MQWSWSWLGMALTVVVILIGLRLAWHGIKSRQQIANQAADEMATKHGLPIIPRDERQFDLDVMTNVSKQEEKDALSDMASAMQAAPIDQKVVHQSTVSQDGLQTAPQSESEQVPQVSVDAGDVVDETFEQQSPVLDRHLDEQQAFDEAHNPLSNYEETITLVVTPQYGAGISGRKVLELVRRYGLKYGAMNMFHRHEHEDGWGALWFSMMAEDGDGPTAFDLNTLAEDHFASLIVFMVLPHKQPLRGFDSMVSTANMLAQDLNAILTDEYRNRITDEYLAGRRAMLIV